MSTDACPSTRNSTSAPDDAPTPLTRLERERLARTECEVRVTVAAFVRGAKALAAIRDGGLYREGYDSFAAYCLDRWDLTEMAEDLPKNARKGKAKPAEVEAA